MARYRQRGKRNPAGSAPGLLVASADAVATSMKAIAFGPDAFEETGPCSLQDALALRGKFPVVWLDITGLADVALIGKLGEAFGLSTLALEDVVSTHQRPKTEEFDDNIFCVLRMVIAGRMPDTEQVSIFFGKDFVISFQERPEDVFEGVRGRLRQARGRIRKQGPDYLAYTLMDAIVDGYFPALEIYGEELETIEIALLREAQPQHMQRIHSIKRDLLLLRRAIWPTRDLVNTLIRDETKLVARQTRQYLRDVYDHVVQLIDIVETYREIASGLADMYISSLSAKMNEVMKVLTIIATIFIPLSFLAGIWGMNFSAMPELAWAWGYPAALTFMAVIALALVYYFWRKGWLTTDTW